MPRTGKGTGGGPSGHMAANVRPYNTGGAQITDVPAATPGTGSGGGGAATPPPAAPPSPLDGVPVVPLDAETLDSRPVTDGSAVGPGAGPEALGGLAPGASSGPDLIKLARYLPALQAMASSPHATDAARQAVRKLRAAIPFDVAMEAFGRKQ